MVKIHKETTVKYELLKEIMPYCKHQPHEVMENINA